MAGAKYKIRIEYQPRVSHKKHEIEEPMLTHLRYPNENKCLHTR